MPLAADYAHTAEIPDASPEAWKRLVDKVLKGADFEQKLVAETADGIRIQPLYTRADAISSAHDVMPGAPPYTRGLRAERPALGWDIRQRFAEAEPDRANAAILADLQGGVNSLILQIASPGQSGLPYTQPDLERALAGVHLDLCPIALDAGEYVTDAAGSLMAIWRQRGIADDRCLGALNADPLGTLARTGSLYHATDKSIAIAAKLMADTAAMPGVTALLADGRPYHSAGAGEAQELAAVIATLVAYLRGGEAAGVTVSAALSKIAVALAADADQFLTTAKIRAARLLIGRVAEACGASSAATGVSITAETSSRMMARRDPWVNMLRTTIAAAGAAIGGADAISVLPFTWALGQPDAFARRIARNIHIVLQEESGLGRVADPAGGSWYVERLTQDLATAAWTLFQEIEAKGGMAASLSAGHMQDLIAATAEVRARQYATGKLALTGVSAFPRLGDDGVTATLHLQPSPADLGGARVKRLHPARLAEPFENLRDAADTFAARSGHPPNVFLAKLGTLADSGPRAAWIENVLAAGGIAALPSDPVTDTRDLGAAFAASGASIAVLCASDAAYAELGEAAAHVLKAAGATHVALAGRPRDQQADLRAAGVDEFFYAGIDAIAVLSALQKRLGVTPH